MYYVLKKPIITEKNSLLAEQNNIFAFEVERAATKTEIKEAVERLFSVKVRSVNTSICRNRATRTKMGMSKVRYWKKAMVKLADGEKISLFEGAN